MSQILGGTLSYKTSDLLTLRRSLPKAEFKKLLDIEQKKQFNRLIDNLSKNIIIVMACLSVILLIVEYH